MIPTGHTGFAPEDTILTLKTAGYDARFPNQNQYVAIVSSVHPTGPLTAFLEQSIAGKTMSTTTSVS